MVADIRFVREDDDEEESWEDRVAKNYESKLFREYALVSQIFPFSPLTLHTSLLASSFVEVFLTSFPPGRERQPHPPSQT